MPILLKSLADLARMRAAGAVVAEVHARLHELAVPGVMTGELNAVAHTIITDAGGYPSFLGYRGFPASICTSVNNEVLHGIPGDRVLNDGDIISIDVGVKLNGFHADAAVTLGIGAISAAAQELIDVTERCFWIGLEQVRAGGRLGDAAAAIQEYAESHGYGVIREYSGHGIGRQMHEDPAVPNYGRRGTGSLLRPGMTFALEPMICAGDPATRVLADNWTVVTIDGSLSAHYEHTVAVLDGEPELLTVPANAVV
jgi:methionyl aminopeptidase